MYVVCVDFQIKPDRLHEFQPLMKKQAETSLEVEPDCHRFDICFDPKDATQVFLYEVYKSGEAFEAHLASDHFIAFDKSVAPMVDKKEVRVLHLVG